MQQRKTVILGLQRCGSTLLASGLNNHPDLKASDIEPLFSGDLNRIKAGFEKYDVLKIMINQIPPSREGLEIWQYLVEDLKVKIIYLKREDLYRQAFSRAVAFERGEWVKKKSEDITDFTEPSKDLVMDYFFSMEKHYRIWDFVLTGRNDVFHLTYEQMTSNKHVDKLEGDWLRELSEFLQVDYMSLEVPIRKQLPQKFDKRIEDYRSRVV